MRYANDSLLSYDTENGKQAMKDMNSMILKYAQTYFKPENFDEEKNKIIYSNSGIY